MSLFQEIRYLVTCDPARIFWQQDGTKANLNRNTMTTKQDGLQVPSEHSGYSHFYTLSLANPYIKIFVILLSLAIKAMSSKS